MAAVARSSARGRPVATSHAEIEAAAFDLFAEHGFEGTTIDAIADRVGVSRRTLFRYFPSKNDIPWGRFADTLAEFERVLEASAGDVPLLDALAAGILAFNDYPASAMASHRDRMRLILHTPELQAHSVHQYAEWRAVIARFVAGRTGERESDLFPQLVSRVCLALAMTAYDQWLAHDEADLQGLLAQAFAALRDLCRPVAGHRG